MVSFTGESGAVWSYEPTVRIGDQSGFGEVFRGVGPDGGSVAVKRVALRWDDEGERRRREREVETAQVLARNPADHVMLTIDVARIGDDLLLVMPLARRSLAAALSAGDLDRGARLGAIRQVAQGLVELAEVSVLHRDLKPANVLQVDSYWQLADFGIARSLVESTGTYTFLGFGTLPYMAPELWNGQPATVKTDLYALGVIAYEIMTGMRPFNGSDEMTLRNQHLREVPPEPTGVSASLGRLMLRMVAKSPAERPQDARAVVEAIDAAIARLTPVQDRLRQAAFAAE
jgi:serine/threonine protein kinase